MSSAERRVVDRYLPWTRIVSDRATNHGGRRVDLLEHAVGHREDLVLKQGIGMQGLQVVLGSDTDEAAWHTLIEEAARAGGSIIQEYVPALPYSLPITPAVGELPHQTDVAPVFSPFLFGGRPAGIWARFHPAGRSGIVSREGFGAMENAVVAV